MDPNFGICTNFCGAFLGCRLIFGMLSCCWDVLLFTAHALSFGISGRTSPFRGLADANILAEGVILPNSSISCTKLILWVGGKGMAVGKIL